MIIYQDFKYLAISWWTIPALLILAVVNGILYSDTEQLVSGFIWNMVFLAFQFIIITLYFTIKNKQLVNITKNYLGIGDMLFFIFLAISFEPVHFILFFTTSLLTILLIFALLKAFRLFTNSQIPLAGGISILYLVLLVVTTFFNYDLYSSDLINSLMF
ncbi:MAG: hypothetical protein A2W99_13335 [Bacteroidetes bacterium GWF2_33_16]|nr:MAG: hypothetical protein A2X00_00940 [Bacteroidetes bacterium GWE2_32_14]OFY06661.1 MAG: hypothetical protein A2W99_13335 [Bacteroidetes bacterium GWF2_33_16]